MRKVEGFGEVAVDIGPIRIGWCVWEAMREVLASGKILVVGDFERDQAGAVETFALGFHFTFVIAPGTGAAPILLRDQQGHQGDQRGKREDRAAE